MAVMDDRGFFLTLHAIRRQLARHGGELSANGLQGEKETAVVHDRNSAVETNRRTMNFQRTANCVLTVCLSPGGRFRCTLGARRRRSSVRALPCGDTLFKGRHW